MIAVDDTAAWNEMCARIRDTLNSTIVQSLVGYAPELRYPDKAYASRPPNEKIWCRISLAQAGEKKRTLARPSRVTMAGIVDIQLFTPVAAQRAAELGPKLAVLLKAALISSTASVDFFGAAIRDMPQEDQWFYKRVNATYNFDVMEG